MKDIWVLISVGTVNQSTLTFILKRQPLVLQSPNVWINTNTLSKSKTPFKMSSGPLPFRMNPHRQIGMQVFFFLLCCFGMRRASEGLFSLFSQVDCCHYFPSRIGNRSVFPGERTHYSKQSTYLMRHDTFYHFSDVCIQCGWHRNVSKLDRPWEKIGIRFCLFCWGYTKMWSQCIPKIC